MGTGVPAEGPVPGRIPGRPHGMQVRAHLARFGLQHVQHLRLPGSGEGRRPRLEDAGLVPGDAFQGAAQCFHVVQTDVGDQGQSGPNHVRRIPAPPGAALDDAPVHGGPRVEQIRQGNPGFAVAETREHPLCLLPQAVPMGEVVEQPVQFRHGNPAVVHHKLLVGQLQIRVDVQAGAAATGRQDARQQVGHGPLAAGAGHVNIGKSLLGSPDRGQKGLETPQGQALFGGQGLLGLGRGGHLGRSPD